MKIKKDSWMVWMIDQAFDVTPKSLCTFFWALVGSIVLAPLAYPVVIYNLVVKFILKDRISTLNYGFGMLLPFISMAVCGKYFEHYYLKDDYTLLEIVKWHPLWLLMILTSVALLVGIIIGIIYLVNNYQDKMEAKNRERNIARKPEDIVEKKPNVIIEYIKAKKQKVCPIIEYTED